MKYEDIITTISEIVNNDKIIKEGLRIVYELDDMKHKQLDEELYIRTNGTIEGFSHQDVIEIEINDIIIEFVKKIT